MAFYHFGQERRKGTDRRVARNAPYAGFDRRVAERRRPQKEREGPFAYIVVALILFIIADAALWDGYYRRAIYRGVDRQAAAVRTWSDGLWNWGSSR